MAETARLADLNDEQYFTDLFTAARMEISSYKGFELWNQLESVGNLPEVAFKEFIGDSQKAIVIGENDNCPLGYMLIELVSIDDKFATNIHEVFVDANAREVGIGEAIMDFTIDWSRTNGAAHIMGRAFPGNRATKNYFERFRITARLIQVFKEL